MKKVLSAVLVCVFLFFFISCGSKTGDEGDTGDLDNSGDDDSIADKDPIIDSEEDDDKTDSDTDLNEINDLGSIVDVPAGEFKMGCNNVVDFDCSYDEYVRHDVTLSAYKIDKYEVTVGEYQKCVDSGNCSEAHYNDGECILFDHKGTLGSSFQEKNKPVVCVEWAEAVKYCEWAGKRLPTEAEWELAARGKKELKYPWGNTPEANCDYAVMIIFHGGEDEIPKTGCGTSSPMVVGSKKAGESPYGAYDMSGNVYEWVSDWYDEYYYEDSPDENPTGPETGTLRVIRGGSWISSLYDTDLNLRVSGRDFSDPGLGVYDIGFRCAVSE